MTLKVNYCFISLNFDSNLILATFIINIVDHKNFGWTDGEGRDSNKEEGQYIRDVRLLSHIGNFIFRY